MGDAHQAVVAAKTHTVPAAVVQEHVVGRHRMRRGPSVGGPGPLRSLQHRSIAKVLRLNEDGSVTITLTGTDPENAPLTFAAYVVPADGLGAPRNLTPGDFEFAQPSWLADSSGLVAAGKSVASILDEASAGAIASTIVSIASSFDFRFGAKPPSSPTLVA